MVSAKIKKSFLQKFLVFVVVLSGSTVHFCANADGLTNLIDDASVVKDNLCIDNDCFFPESFPVDEDIYIKEEINWDEDRNLVLHTKGNIIFEKGGKIVSTKNGSIILKSGMLPGKRKEYKSRVIFEGNAPQIEVKGAGKIKIYYNPIRGKEEHKYHNPIVYEDKLSGEKLETYMLVNDVYDFQGVTACLYGSYALSQNIDASPTQRWNYKDHNGYYQGFYPIMDYYDQSPFSGIFDGNNYEISNLFIYRPDETNVGLFGDVTGVNNYKSTIKNLVLKNSDITGKRCVGGVVGQATGVNLNNIRVLNNNIHSILVDEQIEDGIVGEIAGCVLHNSHKNLIKEEKDGVIIKDNKKLFGSCVRCSNKEADKQSVEKTEKVNENHVMQKKDTVLVVIAAGNDGKELNSRNAGFLKNRTEIDGDNVIGVAAGGCR